MHKFILLASLVACCLAAPTSYQTSKEQDSVLLQRPSPINPDVPSDPKPPEKIIKITDPEEIVKHKREAEDDPYNHISRFAPTVHPARQLEKQHSHESEEQQLVEADPTHHREKREKGEVKDTKKQEKAPAAPAPAGKTAVKKGSPKRSRSQGGLTPAASKKSIAPTPALARDLPKHRQRRQVDPHLLGASTVGVTPLIYRDEEKKADEAEATHEAKSSEESAESSESTTKPATNASTQVKRDIPVPLVPKYHHPEQSPKRENEGDKNDDDSKSDESDESDEDSNQKKPEGTIHNHQPINQSGQPLLAQQHQPQIPAQTSNTENGNTKPESTLTPAAEHAANDEPLAQVAHQHQTQISAHPSHAVEQNDKSESHNPLAADHDTPAGEQLSVNSQLAQHQHTEEQATEQNNHIPVLNDKPALEDLAGIKPTQIISYETPASENTVPIKHPVPVAELFSRPKQ